MVKNKIKSYLKENDFKLTPLEFIALVNSSQDIIKDILLERADAVYTIITKDENKINVEIIPERKKLTLRKDSE